MSAFGGQAAALALAVLILSVPATGHGQGTHEHAAGEPHPAQGHGGHGSTQDGTKPDAPDHHHHDHQGEEAPEGRKPYPPGIPTLTDEDRAAAFPALHGQHTIHGDAVHWFVLFDRLEWQGRRGVSALNWNTNGWIGGDLHRFWFRSEGEGEAGGIEGAEIQGLYGRAIAPWWDLVAGVRQDVGPGPADTWAAVGIQGLAPYWFEVQATAFVSTGGQTQVRLEAEYELLLTNRLILQPLVEVDLFGRSDPERGTGAGLSSADAGLRLRYEIRRELAPYVGVTWERRFFGTADFAREAGEGIGGARLALGLRLWF